jgi:anti-sigma factor RsiW
MSPSARETTEHRDSWDLLPWLVNGRLSDTERGRVEAHLRGCETCRTEAAVQRQLCEAMAADTGVEKLPTPGLLRLRGRMDASEACGPLAESAKHAVPRALQPWRRPRVRAAAAAAAVAALAIGATLLWEGSARQADRGDYYTVTSAGPQLPEVVIRAVFAPQITLSELQAFLDDAHLKIVAGPTEAGVYSLAMTSSHPVEWSLARLRAHEAVRFAEAVGVAPSPAAPK